MSYLPAFVSRLPWLIPLSALLALGALIWSGLAVPADQTSAAGVDWSAMISGLLGGLALFLLGMEFMADNLKAVAGEKMQRILATLTHNRIMAAFTGALVTAVIQSSSITTVLVVGFVSSQLMSLTQAIGVIMGANVGTTVTAQIVAFKVTQYALPMLTLGFALQFFSRREDLSQIGGIIMGLGLIFYGMGLMGEAMQPLREHQPFLDWMLNMQNPLLAMLVAALFTALVQSSSATTGLIIVMAGQGLITLPMGIAMVFGANIGTCVTALLAALGKPREAVRASLIHVIFNLAGVMLWLSFIPELADWITRISPQSPELSGNARLAAEVPRQIANANTVFNVANTVLFLGLAGAFARLVYFLVPERPSREPLGLQAKYLNELLLKTPSLALDAVRRELRRMGGRLETMLADSLPAVFHGNHKTLKRLNRLDNEVDELYAQIIAYLGEISKSPLNGEQTQEVFRLMEVANSLENIGDIIETDLVLLGEHRIERGIHVSEQTRQVIGRFHREVASALRDGLSAVTEQDAGKAARVIAMKPEINRLMTETSFYQANRLAAREPDRVAAYTLETDLLERLRRIYYFAKRMAKTVRPRREEA